MSIQTQPKTPPRKPMGQWLIDNMPRGIDLEIPSRHEPKREIPFVTPVEDAALAKKTNMVYYCTKFLDGSGLRSGE